MSQDRGRRLEWATASTSKCSLVLFERDDVREPLDGSFLRISAPRACVPGHCGQDAGALADSIEGNRNLGDELVAQSWGVARRYHSAALRSSSRASGCSSRRTSLFELLQDLGPRGLPADHLSVTFSGLP